MQKERAANALDNLAANNATNQAAIAAAGGIELLVGIPPSVSARVCDLAWGPV